MVKVGQKIKLNVFEWKKLKCNAIIPYVEFGIITRKCGRCSKSE